MNKNAIIEVEHVSKVYQLKGSPFYALEDINLEVWEGEILAIVGKSGCGKSSLLRVINGLDAPTQGTIRRNGKTVTHPDTDCGMVFQNARLFPWMTVEKNIEFGLTRSDLPKEEKKKRVQRYIDLVGLQDFEKSYPKQLSGGMSQRVSIARSMVTNPNILLLDEPFGALDALTRLQMQKELLDIQRKNHTTMVVVTHDIAEAVYLADRVMIMSSDPGKIHSIIEIEEAALHQRHGEEAKKYVKKIMEYFIPEEQ